MSEVSPAIALGAQNAAQGRMCGNSVSPPVAEAIVRANYAEQAQRKAA